MGGVPPALILAAASGVMAILLLAQISPHENVPASLTSASAAGAGSVDFADAGDAGDASEADAEVDSGPPPPPVWRVAKLQGELGVELSTGSMSKQRTLLAALTSLGVSNTEALRLVHAFDGVRTFDDATPKDTFTVAREKATGKVVAFEYQTSPFDVWQARVSETTGELEAKKLALHLEKKHIAVGVAVGSDLRASIVGAGFDDDLLPLLDDALDGHAELTDVHAGARLRILAIEDLIDGAFISYEGVEAVEYTPAGGDAKPLRVYYFARAPQTSWLARSKKQEEAHKAPPSYFYDMHGRQPMHGGWKSPVPFARIASRFNPKRMHPVLHVIKPHNGVDFAAPPGTPVYASAEGTVKSAGNGGPCGNMVQIAHSSGFTTAYCHLSRFAAGLHAGQHVDAHQLVGYVGSTGRTTGPHLHFAVKRGEQFIDPLALKLDGVRVVPLADRAEFERVRAELDLGLDAVTLPAPLASDAADGNDAGTAAIQFDAGSDDFDETP